MLSVSRRSGIFSNCSTGETSYRPGAAIRYAPADGSSTQRGSTSVRGRVRRPHMAELQAASVPIA